MEVDCWREIGDLIRKDEGGVQKRRKTENRVVGVDIILDETCL